MRLAWLLAIPLAALPAHAGETDDAINGALHRATACSFYSAAAMLSHLSKDTGKVAEASFAACPYEWSAYVELVAMDRGTNDEKHRDIIIDVTRNTYADLLREGDKMRGAASLSAYLYASAFRLRQMKAVKTF